MTMMPPTDLETASRTWKFRKAKIPIEKKYDPLYVRGVKKARYRIMRTVRLMTCTNFECGCRTVVTKAIPRRTTLTFTDPMEIENFPSNSPCALNSNWVRCVESVVDSCMWKDWMHLAFECHRLIMQVWKMKIDVAGFCQMWEVDVSRTPIKCNIYMYAQKMYINYKVSHSAMM